MEQRNLDFDRELSPEEWDSLVRSAETLGSEEAGFARDPERGDEIQLFFTTTDQPSRWEDWVGNDETYGATTREVARFHFNSGRPYAEIEIGEGVEEPVYTEEELGEMQTELERWVRGKWHDLLRESGLDYERG